MARANTFSPFSGMLAKLFRACRADKLILLLLTLQYSSLLSAEQPIVLTDATTNIDLVAIDKPLVGADADVVNRKLPTTLPEMQQWLSQFSADSKTQYSNTYYVHRIEIENRSSRESWMLRTGVMIVSQMDLLVFNPVQGNLVSRARSGLNYPFDDGIADFTHGIEFEIPKGETRQLLLVLNNKYFSGPPIIEISTPALYHSKVSNNLVAIFWGLGVISGLAGFGIVISLVLRERYEYWYTLYLASSAVGWTGLLGISSRYFGWHFDGTLEINLFCISVVSHVVFVQTFLNLKQLSPRINRFYHIFYVAAAANIFSSVWIPEANHFVQMSMLTAISTVMMLYACLYALARGVKTARFVLAGISMTITGVIVLLLKSAEMPILWSETDVVMIVFQSLDAILITLAIADRIQQLRHSAIFSDKLASTDELTRTLNRRGFFKKLESELAEHGEPGQFLSIVFVDLDNMKFINDVKGHNIGDRLLKHLAQLLKRHFREQLCVARLGGDEFVLLFRSRPQDLEQRFTELEAKLQEKWSDNIGVSYGCSLCNGKDDISGSLRQADMAMYRHKLERKAARKNAGRQLSVVPSAP